MASLKRRARWSRIHAGPPRAGPRRRPSASREDRPRRAERSAPRACAARSDSIRTAAAAADSLPSSSSAVTRLPASADRWRSSAPRRRRSAPLAPAGGENVGEAGVRAGFAVFTLSPFLDGVRGQPILRTGCPVAVPLGVGQHLRDLDRGQPAAVGIAASGLAFTLARAATPLAAPPAESTAQTADH